MKRTILKEKNERKTRSKGGFGSNWTTDIRKYLIEGANRKVEVRDPNLSFKKGNLLLKYSESQSQEGGGVGEIEKKRESLPYES